jgi:hypothetical protein
LARMFRSTMASISAIRVRSAECSLVESALRVATLVYRTDGTAFARGGHIEIGKKRDDAAIKSYCCYIPTEFQKGEVDLCFYQCYVQRTFDFLCLCRPRLFQPRRIVVELLFINSCQPCNACLAENALVVFQKALHVKFPNDLILALQGGRDIFLVK